MVTVKADKRYKLNNEYIVFVLGLLLILVILSRYIVNGEPVDIRSDIAETKIELPLYGDMEIRQPLTITEEMNWRQGYYALQFAQCDTASEGRLIYTVEQGEILQTGMVDLCEIKTGEWTRLEGIDLGKLECGEAVLHLRTEEVLQGELAVAVGPDYYGFGIVDYNGVQQELSLAQAYHYHIMGMEYKIRLLCYGIVLLCVVALVLVVNSGYSEDRGKCLAVFGIMTVMFMAVIYLLDSSIYLEPTYAEAVTNFLHNAREENIKNNLLITDAGYLPLLQRLITLFYVKVIRIPSAYALYFMQITACLLNSMIWSFFVLYPFRGLMKLPNRILWCILVMLTCFCEETLFFINHVYWGIYLLLLMLVADLKEFSRWIYAGLLCVCALICLSKGTYAVMLPLMILYLIFFHRSMGKREKIFSCVVSVASFLQILYAFGGQGDGGSWIRVDSGDRAGYLFRLVGRALVEFSAYLLLPIGKYMRHIPGIILVLALAVSVFLVTDFIRTVLIPVIKGKTIDRQQRDFYAVVMFQMIVTVFFLVTVKPVPGSWKGMGNINFGQMGHKYEIFSSIGFYMLLLTGGILLKQRSSETAGASKTQCAVAKICCQYGVLVLMGIFCLTNSVMKLNGWEEAKISDRRVYAGDINAGWWNCKDMLQNTAFFIPVRGDNWGYSRNATIYQVGTDVYFEETSCVNLEEEISGYHSSYEVKDETQMNNLIGVMIRQPDRIKYADCRVQLLDTEDNVIAETGQTGDGRYKKCYFRFDDPVNGVKKVQFVDGNGNPIYYKDYIAWVSVW